MFAGLILLGGCSETDQIRRYTVEKPVPSDRMLAAIIPHGELAWFFKLTGPNEPLSQLAEKFTEFIETVRISGEEPTWELPDGWEQLPGSQTRYATIRFNYEDQPLELSVTRLPKMADSTQLLLQNINRWRGQLQLPPLLEERLPDETVQLELDAEAGLTATLINFGGNLKAAGGMGGAPLASGGPAVTRSPPPSKRSIKYKTPTGWQVGQLVSSRGGISISRDAAFDVVDGNARVEVTVTQLPATAMGLQQNVNRWRQQVELSSDDDPPELNEIDVGGVEGVSMELIGPQRAILGVIAVDQGLEWFIKLYGDRDLALRERTRFREFVESIEFQD